MRSESRGRAGTAGRLHRRALVVLAAGATIGTASAPANARTPQLSPGDPPGGLPQCTITEIDRYPLQLGGRDVYVESEVFLPTDEGILLAGQPVYEWSSGPDGMSVYEEDRILGVYLGDGSVTELSRPDGAGTVRFLRAATSGPGRLVVLLHEVEELEDGDFETTGLTYAERADGGWTAVESLPIPDGADPLFWGSSTLLTTATGLHWLLPVKDGTIEPRVLEYRWTDGRWTHETLDLDAIGVDWVEDTDATLTAAGGHWLAFTGKEPSPDQPWAFRVVHSDDPARGWSMLAAALDEELYSPRLAASERSVVAAWLTGAPPDDRRAWGAVVDGERDPRPFELDERSAYVVPVGLRDGSALWISERMRIGPQPVTLRIHLAHGGAEPVQIGSFRNPYTGFFAAVETASGELVLVGPEMSREPTEPTVRSLVIRLRISCT